MVLLVSITVLSLFPASVFAAVPNSQDTDGNYNLVLISLVCLMLILLFVIGVLANILRQLAFVVRDKNRKEKQTEATVVKTILLLFALGMPAIHAMAAGGEQTRT